MKAEGAGENTLDGDNAGSIITTVAPLAQKVIEVRSRNEKAASSTQHEFQQQARALLLDDRIDLAALALGPIAHFRSAVGEILLEGSAIAANNPWFRPEVRKLVAGQFPLTPTARTLITYVNGYYRNQEGVASDNRKPGKSIRELLSGAEIPEGKRPGYLSPETLLHFSGEGVEIPTEPELVVSAALPFEAGFAAALSMLVSKRAAQEKIVEFICDSCLENQALENRHMESIEVLQARTWIPATLGRHLLKLNDTFLARAMLIAADAEAQLLSAAEYELLKGQLNTFARWGD